MQSVHFYVPGVGRFFKALGANDKNSAPALTSNTSIPQNSNRFHYVGKR